MTRIRTDNGQLKMSETSIEIPITPPSMKRLDKKKSLQPERRREDSGDDQSQARQPANESLHAEKIRVEACFSTPAPSVL